MKLEAVLSRRWQINPRSVVRIVDLERVSPLLYTYTDTDRVEGWNRDKETVNSWQGERNETNGSLPNCSLTFVFSYISRSESGSNYHAGHRRNESMYAMTGLYAESTGTGTDETTDPLQATGSRLTHDTVIRCHSRNPSSGLVDHR